MRSRQTGISCRASHSPDVSGLMLWRTTNLLSDGDSAAPQGKPLAGGL
ncbi:hypothetical protein SEA_SEPHIROTH_76 [Gordonia Phage Sephiroth]|uniref:Uncharacterized protein n=1 Tax=Gordonia Phage Sephiroth TaxID=2767553 RepID=A0A7G9UZL9_9CAUD|nr:hypothetical protein L3Y23_gp076 [Gordonia Phage Sephiroth]QNN99474.1 hypothetical protein SEA_SEPHIROTH_76 [Gordonia Phage Sephiroth]